MLLLIFVATCPLEFYILALGYVAPKAAGLCMTPKVSITMLYQSLKFARSVCRYGIAIIYGMCLHVLKQV